MSFLTVARKEFMDHLSGKRFLVIFAILMAVTLLSTYQGIDRYDMQLEQYKERVEEVQKREEMIHEMEEENPEQAEQMKKYSRPMPNKPSMLLVFTSMQSYFTGVGLILALALGFDLISREKETGSLKSLLSHPVFRDSVINGKILGALMALGFAMVIVTLFTVGFLSFYGLNPTGSEIPRLTVFMGISLLFLVAYFSIAIFSSTVAEGSRQAILVALVLVVLTTYLLPVLGDAAAKHIIGEQPSISGLSGSDEEQIKKQWQELQEYWQKRQDVMDYFTVLSPKGGYTDLSMQVVSPEFAKGMWSPYGDEPEPPSLGETLRHNWINLLSLTVLPFILLVASYVKFMRLDIR
ncbi:MAG: ABC transporter permease [Euryarchaeota archaeon]|nr:ABC transporter permease [Euryarchaeota archaeon]